MTPIVDWKASKAIPTVDFVTHYYYYLDSYNMYRLCNT